MTRPALLALALLASGVTASGVAAQTLPENVLFDDFEYASADWVPELRGTPEAPDLGPPGSLFGPNRWVTSPEGKTETRKLWYRFGWRGVGLIERGRTLAPTARGLRFSVAPGLYAPEGCYPEGSRFDASPQQISTGFTARRGTWVSHVKLGALPDPNEAAMMHSFWLVGHARAWITGESGTLRSITNEVDHEWNNRFLGGGQGAPYDATGAYVAVPERHRSAPMGPPEAPLPTGPAPRLDTFEVERGGGPWSCRYTRGGSSRDLAPEACSTLLSGRAVSGLPAPTGEVWSTLSIHIADGGIRFGLLSDGWGARIEMASEVLSPATEQPLAALLSQHAFHGRDERTCQVPAILTSRRTFEADWFLFSPDPALTIPNARALADSVQRAGVPRLATIPDARLERPARPTNGYASDWGGQEWTTPLSIQLRAPRRMAPGERARILALPPERVGSYLYTWTIGTRYRDGRYTEEVRDDAFSTEYTFPQGAAYALVTVRLEEAYDDRRIVRNETVQPVERVFMIGRR